MSKRQLLRVWMYQRIQSDIEEAGAADIPEIVDDAVEHFTTSNGDFLEEFAHEILRPAAYQDARQIVSRTRDEEAVEIRDEVLTRETFEKRAEGRFARWIENLETHRDVRIMDMTREDCELAGLGRQKRADHEQHLARLFGKLKNGLAEGQMVRDVFSADDIENMYQRIRAEHEEAA